VRQYEAYPKYLTFSENFTITPFKETTGVVMAMFYAINFCDSNHEITQMQQEENEQPVAGCSNVT